MQGVHRTFEIPLPQGLNRQLTFDTEYQELIRFINQSGGSIFADFYLTLSPRFQSSSFVKVDIYAAEQEHIFPIEQGVIQALNKIIEHYAEGGVQLEGFELMIQNNKSHPIDTKPIGYSLPIQKRLKQLINDHWFEKKVLNYERQCPLFIIQEHTKAQFSIIEQQESLQIDLPRIYPSSLFIQSFYTIFLTIENKSYPSQKFDLKFILNLAGNRRRLNHISLGFSQKTPHIIIQSLLRQLEIFKKIIYDRRLNLGGFELLLTIQDERENKYYSESDFTGLTWALLNLVAAEEHFEIVRE